MTSSIFVRRAIAQLSKVEQSKEVKPPSPTAASIYYDVNNVESWDVLNARAYANPKSRKVGTFAHNAR